MTLRSTKLLTIFGLILLTLGVALRFVGLERQIWIDEYSSIEVVSKGNLLDALRHYDHPPLYFLLLKFWIGFGTEIQSLRLLSALISIATILVVFIWLSHFSKRAGFLGAIIFAFLPASLTFSQEIRNYPLLLLLTALSFLSAEIVVRDTANWRKNFLLGISLSLCAVTHLIGIILIPGIALYIILRLGVRTVSLKPTQILSFGLPVLVFFTVYKFFLVDLNSHPDLWWMPALSPNLVSSSLVELIGIPGMVWPITQLKSISQNLALLSGVLVFIVFALFVFHLSFGSFKSSLPLFGACLGYLLALLICSLIVAPVFVARTLLPCLIPFAGFLALQIDSIPRAKSQIIALLGALILLSSATYGWLKREAYTPREDWSEIAQAIEPGTTPILSFPWWSAGVLKFYLAGNGAERVRSFKVTSVQELNDAPIVPDSESFYLVSYRHHKGGAEESLHTELLKIILEQFRTEELVITKGPIEVKRFSR